MTNYERIKQVFDLGAHLFEPEKINLFGVRTWYDGKESNKFDDFKCLAFDSKIFYHKATVDPGTAWSNPEVRKKYNISSADFLLPGQYIDVYRIGNHRGYKALVQTGAAVTVTTGRYTVDFVSGYFGINWHRANELRIVENVGVYSAGCQVTQDADEFEACISLFYDREKTVSIPGQPTRIGQTSFSYTLFEQEEVFDFMYQAPMGGLLNAAA